MQCWFGHISIYNIATLRHCISLSLANIEYFSIYFSVQQYQSKTSDNSCDILDFAWDKTIIAMPLLFTRYLIYLKDSQENLKLCHIGI